MELYKYNQHQIVQKQELEDKEKVNQLKNRLLPFADTDNLSDAQKLAEKILPTKQPYTSFFVGDAKCTIINKTDMLRISIDTTNEFICYDFS